MTQKRLEIAEGMRLNVGEPNEYAQLPNGENVRLRDDLGLCMDPMTYASKNCSTCSGRGTYVQRVHVPNHIVLKMVAQNAANEALFEKDMKNNAMRYFQRVMKPCGCAHRRYSQRRDEFGKAIVAAGLAERVQSNENAEVSYVLRKDG